MEPPRQGDEELQEDSKAVHDDRLLSWKTTLGMVLRGL